MRTMLAKHSAFARKAGSVLALVACLSGGHLAVGQDTRLFRADGFNPGANDEVRAVAVQADGKVLIGGSFSQLSPNGSGSVGRNCIARLNRDGTVDVAFNPNANGRVRAIAVQPDGNILIGGEFTTLSPNFGSAVTRNRIARLKPDGTIDPTFDPSANGSVQAIALQPDGKILIAGDFTTLAPASAAPATRKPHRTFARQRDARWWVQPKRGWIRAVTRAAEQMEISSPEGLSPRSAASRGTASHGSVPTARLIHSTPRPTGQSIRLPCSRTAKSWLPVSSPA
jgi:uncharacterized delta-60 repeat protein